MFKSRLSLIFSVVTLLLLAVSAFFALRTQHLISNSLQAEGIVTNEFIQPPTTRFPEVQFVTATGDTIMVRGSVGSDPPEFEVGDKVTVFYQAANPHDATIGSFWSLWFTTVFFAIFGFVCLIITIVAVVMDVKSSESSDGSTDFDTKVKEMRSTMPQPNDSEFELRRKQREFVKRFEENEAKSNVVLLRVVYAFLAIGGIMIGVGSYLAWTRHQFVTTRTLFQSHIVDYTQGGRYAYPLYEFRDEHGVERRAYADVGTRGGSQDSIGTEVDVFYDTAAKTVVPNSLFDLYFASIICLAIGIVFSGFGLLFRFLLGRTTTTSASP